MMNVVCVMNKTDDKKWRLIFAIGVLRGQSTTEPVAWNDTSSDKPACV